MPAKPTTRDRSAERERNRAFVGEVNARTACAHCGAQPIEWHNPEHVELDRQSYRISAMVQQPRTIEAIKAEMARCTPLCRRCHMIEDGRLNVFVDAGRRFTATLITAPSPCSECGRLAKPLARGLCMRCYNRQPDQRERVTRWQREHGKEAQREHGRKRTARAQAEDTRYGIMRIISHAQGWRLYECPCGIQVYTLAGKALKHVRACLLAQGEQATSDDAQRFVLSKKVTVSRT